MRTIRRLGTRSAARRWHPPLLVGIAAMLMAVIGVVAVGTAPAGADTPTADLGVTITASPNVVAYDTEVTYVATVTNAGPDTATNTVLIDPFSTFQVDSTKETVTTTSGTCTLNGQYSGGFVTCDLGTLAVAGSATVTIVATPEYYSGGPLANTVSVASDATDPVTTNNSATSTQLALPPPSYEELLVDGYSKVLLRRAPTSAEVTAGTATMIHQGIVPYVESVLATPTYRTIWVSQQVERYLHRSAGSGAGYYVNWLAEGRTYDQVIASLVSSSEFVHKTADPTHWVASAYRVLTGTNITAKQQAGYEAWLHAGAARYQVVLSIVTSGPARSQYVKAIFKQFLKRSPNPSEQYIDTLNIVSHKATPETFEATILGGFEFYRQFEQLEPIGEPIG